MPLHRSLSVRDPVSKKKRKIKVMKEKPSIRTVTDWRVLRKPHTYTQGGTLDLVLEEKKDSFGNRGDIPTKPGVQGTVVCRCWLLSVDSCRAVV